jgi:LPXTG-motif cell wall-anchored protein
MSNRIQREVEELLDKLEKFPPKRPLPARIADALAAPFRAAGRAYRGLALPRVTAGHVLLAGLAIIVVAYVVGGTGSGWRWVIAVGIVLFVGAFLFSLRRQSSGPQEKYWRDKPLDLHGKRGPWWDNWRNKRR